MRNQLILAAAAVPSLRVADVEYNTEQIIRLIAENSRCGLIVFPELSVTGYTCADLFGSELLLKKAQEAMFIIAKTTEEYRELTVIIGVPIRFENNLYNCAAVISAGKKPVLGICRGIQFINAALGGTLYQDLPLQHSSDIEHHQSPPYDIPVHEVAIVKDSPLYQCLKTGRLFVNSYHHQAVKTLAESLKVMAEAPDGTIEAVYMPGHCFLWAVQWHPEISWRTDEHSRKIFKDFITHCF